jgi:translation initiation factor 4E
MMHTLNEEWVLYAHLPYNTDWSFKSYIKIMEICYIEDILALNKEIPDTIIEKCMLFLMRKGIKPMWEDENNRAGGCFSYKISDNPIETWKTFSYLLLGETICKSNPLDVNGITLSPKKNFWVLKIWMRNCHMQDPHQINYFKGISPDGCLFKTHNPEF